MPSIVRIPVKVNASTLSIPIDWATNDDPQIMAVKRRSIIPCGLVRRIEFPFDKQKKYILESYIFQGLILFVI